MDKGQLLTEEQPDAELLLRDFFCGELPSPWPPFRHSVEIAPQKSQASLDLGRSHVGLAASVLVLIAGLGVGSFLLRTDTGGSKDEPLFKESKKPAAPGKLHKPPPAIAPMPEKPGDGENDAPFSLAYPGYR